MQWMADGRERAEWAHTAALMLGFQRTMTGTGPQLLDLIPERYRDDAAEERSEEDEAAESALAFAELEAGLKAMSRQAGPRIAGFTG